MTRLKPKICQPPEPSVKTMKKSAIHVKDTFQYHIIWYSELMLRELIVWWNKVIETKI